MYVENHIFGSLFGSPRGSQPPGAPLPDLAHDRRLAREVAGEVAKLGATSGDQVFDTAGWSRKAKENPS